MPHLRTQLRWLIAIRVVVITSVVLPYFLFQLVSRPEELAGAEFLYPFAGVTYLLTLLYLGLDRLLATRPELQGYVQFAGDLGLVTGLVYYSGGIGSPFSILYLVVIAVAAALLRRRAGVSVASGAYLLYTGLVLGLFLGWWPEPALAQGEVTTIWRLAYNLASHLVGFYAVALLTSHLAHNVAKAERELQEKRLDLADLQIVHKEVIESVASGIMTADLEGRVTSLNRAGEEILGTPKSDLVGRPIEGSGLFSDRQWRRMVESGVGGKRFRAEVEWQRGGQPRYVGFSINRLTDAESRHKGYIVTFQDLTEWRKLQEELRLKDRMAAVGELAAGMAHEIGNPLAAISGSVQILDTSLETESPHRRLLRIILKESSRLDRTIKGFLRFARPKERSTQRFDIASLLRENLELLRNSHEIQPTHHVQLDLEPNSAHIVGDPDQVSQIFWNLARNALRAMSAGGELRIVGRLSGSHYRLEFHDTGRGMSEDERAKLFQPFQGFFDGGMGIGMAIVYQIVEEHGGRVTVDSRPGEGTSIRVELPAAKRPRPAPAVSAKA